ncbi:trafficking protein particle complex subunit 5-like [Corticium candelabrum]|uniref:trafficking protein particle complex subunit 5-like n=1 Tax=Corticium candelabrum TaxID=121492 RepID=UPI002E2539C8|nr:trafficking protein particle complex subunit 5-like [Corticium candelabrum]
MSSGRSKPPPNILDRPLSRGKSEVNLSTFALLFSEIVQYSQHRVLSVAELQTKLAELGQEVGIRMLDILAVRERGSRRETRLLNVLLFIKGPLWKTLFGKEADNLEHATGDESTYYIIEKEPIINKFISVPKDKSSLNCASFSAGIVEGVLNATDFPAKVTAHWHKGTTLMIKFKDSVLSRERTLDGR